MSQTITLYKGELKNVCAPVDKDLWSFAPRVVHFGEEPEGVDFILPDGFEVVATPFGKAVAIDGTKTICQLAFTITGYPQLDIPNAEPVVLERA